jgi:uncharacterized protein YciI
LLLLVALASVSGANPPQGGGALAHAVVQEQKYEMTTFYLALFVPGPKATATPRTAEEQAVFGEHVARMVKLIGSGTFATAGPFGDGGRVRGVAVVNAGSKAEAESVLKDDPAVKAGYMAVEVHPWYAAKNIMKPATDISSMDTYYFAFLRRGPKAAQMPKEEVAKIQEAHMGHIQSMAASGSLVLAGPFAEDGELRGVFIFKVATIDEARALAEADPAVQAGRLVVDLHPWHVPKGALP